MANERDIELTFDEKSFKNSLDKMGQQFKTFASKSMENMKNISNTMKLGFIAVTGFVSGAFQKAFHFISGGLPELKKSFEIAGNIIQRNLFWPLRQELIPILQKMLNWVRDNRSMFVQWGMVLVNVFKMVKTVFTTIIDLAKTFFNAFIKQFGGFKMSLSDFINLIIFKLTAFAIMLGILLQPIFEKLGEWAGEIMKALAPVLDALWKLAQVSFKAITDFFTGFFAGLSKTFKVQALVDFLDACARLINTLTGDNGKSINWIYALGYGIGFILGILTTGGLEVLTAFVDTLDNLLNLKFDKLGGGVINWFRDFGKEAAGLFSGKGWDKQIEDVYKKIDQTRKKLKGQELIKFNADIKGASGLGLSGLQDVLKKYKVQDAIIKPNGSIIETDPQDTIIATKNGINRTSGTINNKTVKIEFGNINLNVTEGNAKQAGKNYAQGMMDQIYQGLLGQYVGSGAR